MQPSYAIPLKISRNTEPESVIIMPMSSISRDDVDKLAALSALSLSDDQAVALQTDLTQILNYVDALAEVNTDGVEPTYSVHGLESVTRTDEVIDYGITREQLLQNAPKHDGAHIVVPRVLE